ncbi:hypothetical protein CTheo_8384 [Ceratobasidium theobromae]|uniref:Uncharacterized protein n=1 Tax=Ceratobasidium theobromae TaxID=1582974 RepID=A0A5N5Q9V1_9AGAM|nr:hypothetical protein CTheo_8384 [Ceratobasidium theobromae]
MTKAKSRVSLPSRKKPTRGDTPPWFGLEELMFRKLGKGEGFEECGLHETGSTVKWSFIGNQDNNTDSESGAGVKRRQPSSKASQVDSSPSRPTRKHPKAKAFLTSDGTDNWSNGSEDDLVYTGRSFAESSDRRNTSSSAVGSSPVKQATPFPSPQQTPLWSANTSPAKLVTPLTSPRHGTSSTPRTRQSPIVLLPSPSHKSGSPR